MNFYFNNILELLSLLTKCSNAIFNLFIANNMINFSKFIENSSSSKQYGFESYKIDDY